MDETSRRFADRDRCDRPWQPRIGRWRLPAGVVVPAAAAIVGASLLVPGVGVHGRANDEAGRVAERTVRLAASEVARAKREGGIAADPAAGPGAPALIGDELTPLVTTLGSLEAKRLATNPAWASHLASEFRRRGVGPGEVVVAAFSGSFPGLNLAVIAACRALGADLAAVSSVTASTWGANQPGFTWPEIEARLVARGVIGRATIAVSSGGAGDQAADLEPDGRALARAIRDRAARDLGVPVIDAATLEEAIGRRMDLFERHARGRPIRLFVNVGGTEAGLGRSEAVLRFGSGFITPGRFDNSPERGLIARFGERGVPVLLLLNLRDLAMRWQIPLGVDRRE